jgi:hypothetical protein
VPVNEPPELFRLSVALRSPIGVVIVRFQSPSTAIRLSLKFLAKPEMALRGGITHLAAQAQSV